MPEPSGTGSTEGTTTDQPAAGQPAAGEGGASGTQNAGGSAQDQKLSAEAAKWRTQYRESQKQIDAMRAELEDLKTKMAPASPGGDQSTSEVATLKREMAELRKTLDGEKQLRTKAEELSKQEKLDNAILKALGDGKVLGPDEAAVILKAKGRARVAEDGKPVFVISESGEDREVEISAESIRSHKLLSDRFYPSEGAAGSGSRGGSRTAAGGVDMNRIMDPEYFAKNKDAILAAKRAGA